MLRFDSATLGLGLWVQPTYTVMYILLGWRGGDRLDRHRRPSDVAGPITSTT